MLAHETRTLRDVQAVLLSMFHAKTILIGHSLESDLKTLKLIHDVVVDTSVLFPHKMGPPKKRALKTLCIENLKRIIQESGQLPFLHNFTIFKTFINPFFVFQRAVMTVLKMPKFAFNWLNTFYGIGLYKWQPMILDVLTRVQVEVLKFLF